MKKYLFILFCITSLLVACTNPLQEREEKLLEQIRYIHDVETMPKMGLLERLKSQLDTLQGVDKKVIFSKKKGLNDSYDEMMDWMAQYNAPSDVTPIEQRIEYYESEVKKLETMRKNMFGAIEEAKTTLQSTQNK